MSVIGDEAQARCPETNYPLLINAEAGSWGCGWCKRKSGAAEPSQFVAERRSRSLRNQGRYPI